MQRQLLRTPSLSLGNLEFEALACEQAASLLANPSANSVRNVIDYSKFKTKLCRNFLMGIACPFEHRCAFAHSVEEQLQGRSMASPPAISTPPSYNDFCLSTVPSSESLCESPESSRPSTPPTYPTRFRYEPYSPAGVVFAH